MSRRARSQGEREDARSVGPADAELVVRVLAGDDRHAFAQLVRRHQSAVRSLLRRLCGDAALADDLAQECFVRAYQNLRQVRAGARLAPWLYRIAYNLYLSRERKRTEELAGAQDEGCPAWMPTPEGHLDPVLLHVDLERAMGALRPEQRAALALTFGQGISHDEAAQILEWPVGTLKTHVNRAKARLRQTLLAWQTESP